MGNARIKEKTQPKTFTNVSRVKTNLQGGGTCLWKPEDELTTEELSVNQNGSWTAEEIGLYGWIKVTANVPNAGSVTGKDPTTGEDVSVSVDPETGEIIEETLPAGIEIVTLPTKTMYVDGEAIDYTGIEVVAVDGHGEVWQNEKYPNGMIPFDELIFTVGTAAGGSGDMHAGAVDPSMLQYPQNDPIVLCDPSGVSKWFTSEGNGYIYNVVPTGQLYGVCINSNESFHDMYVFSRSPFTMGRIWTNDIAEKAVIPATDTNSQVVEDNELGTYFRLSFGSSREIPPFSMNQFTYPNYSSLDFAKQIFGGTIRIGGTLELPVKWTRPNDYQTLETSFNVNVNSTEESGSAY